MGGGHHGPVSLHCKAETLRATLQDCTDLPEWHLLRDQSPVNIDATTSDKGSANLKAENTLHGDRPANLRLKFACSAHRCSTAQGRAYSVDPDMISGVIALALALQPAGKTSELRAALAASICQSVVVCHGSPPQDGRAEYRDAVLDAIFTHKSAANFQRKTKLRLLLTGWLHEHRIEWYVNESQPDIGQYASLLADALLPSKIPVFKRHRWVNSQQLSAPAGIEGDPLHNKTNNVVKHIFHPTKVWGPWI